MTVLTQTPWTLPTDRELTEALTAACGAVGTLPLTSAAWDELLPLVHECADALTPTVPPSPWPPSAIQACRRLAVVTRHLERRPTPPEVDRELVLALADLIVLRAHVSTPTTAEPDGYNVTKLIGGANSARFMKSMITRKLTWRHITFRPPAKPPREKVEGRC